MATVKDEVLARIAGVRASGVLTQCITNYVSMDLAANVLLSCGTSPAMVHAESEAADFTRISGALLINIGTASPSWVAGMEAAATEAGKAGIPWVLDPVGCGATPWRTELCVRLATKYHPTAIRGNASEIMALAAAAVPDYAATVAAAADARGKGVDSLHASHAALTAARCLARAVGCIVGVSGEIDYVTSGVEGEAELQVANGSPLLTKITAAGCSLTALLAACLGAIPAEKRKSPDVAAVRWERMLAAAAAFAYFGAAADIALSSGAAHGPGSLRVALLDTLYGVTPEQLAATVKVSATAV